MPRLQPIDLMPGTIRVTRAEKEFQLAKISINASAEAVKAITGFYNANFKEKHTVQGRMRRYRNLDALPLNIVLTSDMKIVGLLESSLTTVETLGKERIRLLATLLIDPAYRKLGLSRPLFEEFLNSVEKDLRVVVRFRNSNREALEGLYREFGFTQPEGDGMYGRSKERRWRMIREAADKRIL